MSCKFDYVVLLYNVMSVDVFKVYDSIYKFLVKIIPFTANNTLCNYNSITISTN